MGSKIKKISEKEISINAFNPVLRARGAIFFLLLIVFVFFCFINGMRITLENIILLCSISLGFHILYFKDWLTGYMKYLKLGEDYILVNKRKVPKKYLSYVSVVVSSVTTVAIITSYRVNIVLEKGIFREISLISFTSSEKQLAEQTGKEIADFLGIEFRGIDSIWE